MLTSVVLVLGLTFIVRLPLDLLPKIVYPSLRASVSNPGVDPEVMEQTVAKPLEAALAVTEGVSRIETDISQGNVGVNLTFRYGMDMDFALQDAAKNLERVRGRLPEEADPANIFKFDPSQISVYEVAFSSSSMDLIQLRTWVDERLRPQLLLQDGVASIDIMGGLIREIRVVLDQERLRSYGLTVSQIIDAVRSANQDVAAGRLTTADREIVGTTQGKFRSVDDIRNILLTAAGGARIPLTEIAVVEDAHQEQRQWARLDGVPSVRLSVRKQPKDNTVEVADGVNRRLHDFAESGFIPDDVQFRILQNQAVYIRQSINSVRNSALLGATLAMIVVFIFLRGVRKTIIIGAAIPLAILATFVMMGFTDLTLNIMSLGGLALGVGLLIDNSIVMLENIFRKHDEEGILDGESAAHAGSAEVQSAVIASTATNLAAVVPFLLVSGLSAMIFKELILTISFAIVASLGVALTLVPMLSAQLAKVKFTSGVEQWRVLVAFDHALDFLKQLYRRVMPTVLRFGFVIVFLALAGLYGVWQLTRTLPNEFLPQVDDGGVSVSINLPPGSLPQQTNRIAQEVEGMVNEMPDVEHMFASAGGRSNMDIRLAPLAARTTTADEWVAMLQARIDARGFAGARVSVRPPRIRGLRTSSSGADIAISVQGEDLGELRRIGDEIMLVTRGVPGLNRLEAGTEARSPQLAVELERERASYLGLNVGSVGQTLRTALDGTVATRYTEGNREYDVRVMLPREQFTSAEDLASVALFPGARGGPPVYLRDVARVFPSLGPTTIQRENQSRHIRLTGDVITEIAPISAVNDSIRARLSGLELPQGYGLIYGGEEEAIRDNNRQLLVVVLLAVFLVFVVLAVLYESLLNPLIILLTIPLSLIGVGVGLYLTNTPMSAPALLGVILLAGIVVNNAILLLEYVEQFRSDHGSSMEEAVVQAGVVRLRPILMTTLTTMFGMLPLALGLGEGSELMRPLAIAVVSGMSVSTFLTLFVVPTAYVGIHRIGDKVKFWVTGKPIAHAH
jgi:hydrophobe/amphiphile efflux-1 (HAE1) family protein